MKKTGTDSGLVLPGEGLAAWRRGLGTGKVPALIAGTFDILQPGNCMALRRAAALSSHVCVLLESDTLAQSRRGAYRPRNALDVRMELVSRLRDVSAVSWVDDEEGAKELFRALAPFALIVAGERRLTDGMAAAAAAAGTRIVEVETVPGCFTEQIHAAISGGRTPIKLPAGLYPGDGFGQAFTSAPRPGQRLVTVNGCFDILHIGHVRLLEKARSMGSELVVLINDDASVSAYKGARRPVFPLPFRMAALKMFRCVTDVVPFSGDNPLEAISRIRPDIHVKGGSFEPERVRAERELVESWGGRLVGTALVEGYSTTDYIRETSRIKP